MKNIQTRTLQEVIIYTYNEQVRLCYNILFIHVKDAKQSTNYYYDKRVLNILQNNSISTKSRQRRENKKRIQKFKKK